MKSVFVVLAIAVASPLAAAEPNNDAQAPSDHLALNAVFGDEFIADDVAAIESRAQQLELLERYRILADWVLPSESHATIRMNGRFAPTFRTAVRNDIAGNDGRDPSTTGIRLAHGGLYCPGVELIDVAKQLNRLQQLRERVTQLPDADDEQQRRAKVAMLFLIDAAGGDETAAAKSADALTSLVMNSTDFDERRQWPQTVAAWIGLRDPKTWPFVADMVTDIRARQLLQREGGLSTAWSEQMASMDGLLQHRRNNGSPADFTRRTRLNNWIPASIATAQSNAAGYPRAHWHWDEGELQNLASHRQSLLFYRIPLRGNFEISCELPFPGIEELHVMYAGEYVIPLADLRTCRIGNVHNERTVGLDRPLTEPYGPPWLRIGVRDGVCTTWFNGRVLSRRRLADDHDPWLAIRATSSRANAAVRKLRIDGTPDVPDEVNLCATESLPGWWSYYPHEPVGPGLVWQHVDDRQGKGVHAARRKGDARPRTESLLRYYRPLAEGDSLEYDFLYEPDDVHVHPAVDDLAFLLAPDGVKVHRVTDGLYEQGEAEPDGAITESENRRGPALLPLKAGAWNRCRLLLREGRLELSLNGQLVYSQPLETTAQRVFGLFRYAEASEVQVRNVIWRPQSARRFDEVKQQFVNRPHDPADAKFNASETFQHDFTANGLPAGQFTLPSAGDARVAATADGVAHFQRSRGGWTDSSIVPVYRMQGDFDATAEFADLQVTDPGYGGCAVVLRTEDGRIMQLSRRMRQGDLDRVYLTWRSPAGDGEFRMIKEILITEALAGRLRVSRRGDTYYFLIAEHDSPAFRLVGQETIDGAAQQAAQLELRMIASIGSSASTDWKNVQLAAKKLTRFRFQPAGRVITDDEWATLANADALEELDLDGTDVSDDGLANLRHLSKLRLLYLKGTTITSRGVRHLAKLKRLRNLHLTSTPVDDGAAAALGELAELESLGLSITQVGDATIAELSKLRKIKVIGLSRTAVTDASVENFSKMASLRRLNLRNTQVTAAGVEQIRKALPKCNVQH